MPVSSSWRSRSGSIGRFWPFVTARWWAWPVRLRHNHLCQSSLVTCHRLLGLRRESGDYLGLRFFHGGKSAGQLRIDSLAVAPNERGSGVGRLLLHEVFALARERGFTSVILEVVDSNPRARNLYELLGFRSTAVYRYPWLTRGQGFTGHTVIWGTGELGEVE